MDSGSILEFLGHLKATHVHHRGKWVQCSCLLAPWLHDSGKDAHPSFAIRVEPNGESYFNCFVCESGKLSDLLIQLQHFKAHTQGADLGAAWELVAKEADQKINLKVKNWGDKDKTEPDIVIPEGWLQSFQIAWQVPYAREYLESRMVTEKISHELEFKWDRSMQTVGIPIRNREGELVSFRGRRIFPTKLPPYHVYSFMGQQNGQAWLGEHSVDYDRPVLMVESVFDYASVKRVYANVLAPLSVGINQERMKRVSECNEVVTYFDQGAGGNKARGIVKRGLGSASVIHVIPTDKDPGMMKESAIRQQLGGLLKLHPLTNSTN